jgi:PAS domain S-box-containing protein
MSLESRKTNDLTGIHPFKPAQEEQEFWNPIFNHLSSTAELMGLYLLTIQANVAGVESIAYYTVNRDKALSAAQMETVMTTFANEIRKAATQKYVDFEAEGLFFKAYKLDNCSEWLLLCSDTKKVFDNQKHEIVLALLPSLSTFINYSNQNKQYHVNQSLLQALSAINTEFTTPSSNKRQLFKQMLANMLSVTGSEYGFIGEILHREGQPYLKTYAITDISWDEQTRALYQKYEQVGMEFTNLNTLFGYTIKTGEHVISNDPANDSKRGGLPRGHPPLNHYLGIPLHDKENTLVGMLGIANKKGGYSEDDIRFLEPIVSLASAFISSIKSTEAKDQMSGYLNTYKDALNAHSILAVTDSLGTITFVNQRFCDVSKYSSEELIGQNHRIVNSGYHPKSFFENLWNTINSGKKWQGEIKNKAKDGSFYWVDTTIVPFMDETNKPYQFISIRNDITQLKEQEQELQNFFRLSLQLMCIADTEGNFKKVSSSFENLLGYSEEELLSIPFLNLIHPEDIEKTKSVIAFMLSGGKSTGFQNRYYKKDGSTVLLSWTASINPEDHLIYATAIDITESDVLQNKLIESRLEVEKAKEKDKFLANMSHEIRTPLNAIIGFTDLLSETEMTHQQRAHVDIISSALKNLNVIINDILDISKLESGKLELEKREFNLEHLAKQVIQMHSARAKSKNIKLMLNYDSEIPTSIVGDETRLSQILTNLISNAIKFTAEGFVELRIIEKSRSDRRSTISFAVKDSGIGIEKANIRKIFERFSQAEDYTTRVYGGTGLGLNIVKSLVELHHGKLDVSSEPGKGSEFTAEITYTFVDPDDVQDTKRKAKKSGIESLEGRKILLVEDNEHNQILAQTFLQRRGAVVEIAGNGKIALNLLQKENSFDLILMDIQMPIMDGLQTTRQIRTKLKIETPIIGCSAHALASERNLCLETGMNDYITKPYTEAELVNSVAFMLEHGIGKAHTEATQKSVNPDHFELVFEEIKREFGPDAKTQLLNAMIYRVPNDIHGIDTMMETNDFNQLAELLHNLAGSFGSLRMYEGLEIAREFENAVKKNNKAFAVDAQKRLKDYLERFMLYTTQLNA